MDAKTDELYGLVRHALTYGGGLLTAMGYLTADQNTALINAIIAAASAGTTIVGIVWSLWNKFHHKQALAAAKGLPPGGPPSGPAAGAALAIMLAFAALTLQACGASSATGTAAPQTPKETLVALETSYTAALQTANDLVEQKIITGHGISDIIAADSLAQAALDNADAMVLLASAPSATSADQANATKALQIAQTAVASLLTILQQQQQQSGSK
jgi:hypothetical protein